MNNFLEHVPVLLNEILENLKKFEITNGVIIDATFGLGGYSNAILENTNCEVSNATAFSICQACEKVTEIVNSKLSKYLKSFQDSTGMKYKKYNLEFFGLCQKCKSK